MFYVILNKAIEECYSTIEQALERFSEVVEGAMDNGITSCHVFHGNDKVFAYNVK